MCKLIWTVGAVLAAFAPLIAATAQTSDVAAGATAGAIGGAIVGGPVGLVVGGVGGAIVGGITDATQPEFRTYVVEQKRPSYTYAQWCSTIPVHGCEQPDGFGRSADPSRRSSHRVSKKSLGRAGPRRAFSYQ